MTPDSTKNDSCVCPRILGHRGTFEAFTENAPMAFRHALENGVTGFETDFRMTADGVVVVMHDRDIRRTTTGEGAVEAMTLSELKRVRMRNSDEQVPTAEELFALLGGWKGLYIEMEMKARFDAYYSPERMDEYLDKLHEAARLHLGESLAVFTCFDSAVLRRLKTRHPDARIGLICEGLDQATVDTAIALGCYSVAPTLDGTAQTHVDQLRAAGLKVNLWFSDTVELWRRAQAMGADVSTCNYPVTVLRAVREAGPESRQSGF